MAKTNIQIILGDGESTSTAGGDCPHIALWDDDGNRIGQYHPKSCDIKQGNVGNFVVEHSQTTPKYSQADPYYVMVSQLSDDAICVASIAVQGTKISGSFFGDTGYMCGQSWYASENRIGSDFTNPRCVWLDGNHDNGINARAISFHLNDMQPNQEKMSQYMSNQDTLCKSSPRFSFWGNLLPDGIPPFFSPPLTYKDGNGADTDLSKVIDDPKNPVDKGVYLHQGESHRLARSRTPKTTRRNVRGWNHNPDHLVVSDQVTSSARELCTHPNSYGWDIVSTKENLFCDMEHKKLYPLCSNAVTDGCFDLDAKTLRGHLNARSDDTVKMRYGRSYASTAHWKEPKQEDNGN
ncbi:hypothetical protein EJ05DRAFT_491242 [Pseudovirgaria hyperparasitica]|uniref:Uncharacterized protein n=1 Tax=Pseudovirgaria hyperparasitica TaxID=470096 RepID=A0A6A6WM35_9PEZI|nr:uncharacterized protein EJ05DRAFT_491242 [Pseudovirgaria hyperparasitica]KAF2763222.1 hypothetical protein EJ05DRAFT_491242 [Pseudovirgaria hyperparasitica]